MADHDETSETSGPPEDRLRFVNEWSEDRLITVEVFINEDGSEGLSANYGRGIGPDRHQQLLKAAAALLADAAERYRPPPPRRP